MGDFFCIFQALEAVLPPRPAFTMPAGEHVEEVGLYDYDPNDRSSGAGNSRGEAYQSDDEDSGGRHIQCPAQ